jgi:hypothetical protein
MNMTSTHLMGNQEGGYATYEYQKPTLKLLSHQIEFLQDTTTPFLALIGGYPSTVQAKLIAYV